MKKKKLSKLDSVYQRPTPNLILGNDTLNKWEKKRPETGEREREEKRVEEKYHS